MKRVHLCLLALLFSWSQPSWGREVLTVFAPASLSDVLAEVNRSFAEEAEVDVRLSIAGTGQIARQIVAGAPADLFLTADRRWMEWAVSQGGVDRESVTPVAGNSLVVAVSNEVENWVDVPALLRTSRFAMGEPETVPAGTYAKQALIKRGWWADGQRHAVYGENVRVALARLRLGDVGAAVVYRSDVVVEPGVKEAFRFLPSDHAPITYLAALVSRGELKKSARYLAFLKGITAQSIFAQAGFAPPPEQP